MDNYEINILRRDGNWKKVKPDDLIIDSIKKDDEDKAICRKYCEFTIRMRLRTK